MASNTGNKSRDLWHEATGTDDLLKIATEYGFSNWKEIYDHPDNKKLKEERPNPHTLAEGDKIWIPKIIPKKIAMVSGATNMVLPPTQGLVTPLQPIFLELKNNDGSHWSEILYEIWIDDSRVVPDSLEDPSRTNKQGEVKVKIPICDQCTLKIYTGDEIDEEYPEDDDAYWVSMVLNPGSLNPVDTPKGVQDRLIALDFNVDAEEYGKLGETTTLALKEFQEKNNLPSNGKIDEKTSAILKRIYGS